MSDSTPDVLTVVPASYAQQRLWFFDRLQPGSALYNVPYTEMLTGPFDRNALSRTLDEVVRRHEALRTVFSNESGQLMQHVMRPAPAPFALVDPGVQAEEARGGEVHRIIGDEFRRGFDLQRGPLLRFTVILLGPRHQLLLMVAHHIVFDLWSSGVLGQELPALYASFRRGDNPTLPEPKMGFAEFVAQQRARFDSDRVDPQLAYWRTQLKDLPRSSEFPTDKLRPASQTYRGAECCFTFGGAGLKAFRASTRAAGLTLFMSFFAAYAVLLHRYSGQADLAIGTPIANRAKTDLGDMIGFLLNMIVLRIDLADDPTVAELMARARAMALAAFDHQDVPLELLVKDLRPERDPSRHALFQTMFVFLPGAPGAAGGDEVGGKRPESNGAKFDVTMTLTDHTTAVHGILEYNPDLFLPDTMERMAGHFQTLIQSMAAAPEARISRLPILTEAEHRRLMREWSAGASVPLPRATLADMIGRAIAADPAAIVAQCGTSRLSYGELDQRAAALARRLRRLGAGPDRRIGVCMERSLDWVVAIAAVMRSGAAMVPLDPGFPAARLAFMVEDADVLAVLTEAGPAAGFADVATRCVRLDLPPPREEDEYLPSNEAALRPHHLAYVVYTSGSTGRPKGVLVQHDSVVNFVTSQARAWDIGPGARVLQFTAFGFDIGLSEIFLALTSGATLCLAPQNEMMPGQSLLSTLRGLRITHVTLPPSALAATTPESLPDLRLVISAGEPCEPGLARRWSQFFPIVNAYGPTEATIYATVGDFDPISGLFPVGRPIANTAVYVLDRHGAPTPAGVAGEIVIGGVGVARGYLNQPELTHARFLADNITGKPGALLYRTGDLGRFDGAGALHHLGRADGQLKIRGYRIEPGEVECVLRLHPQVIDAVALGIGAGPDSRLIAYVIATETPPLAIELRGFLGLHLPDYMKPAAYVMLKAWPKTANGKIDRNALPRPDRLPRDLATPFIEPASDAEQAIAAIWRDCLGVQEIGGNDNFFDLGGHSLLLVRVHDRLREAFATELTLIDLFRLPTIALLSEAVRTKSRRSVGSLSPPASPPKTEQATDVRAEQRAAMQNAARMQRRNRIAGGRNA